MAKCKTARMTDAKMADCQNDMIAAAKTLRASGQKVTFEVTKHIYTVAKREIPSVTTIIKSETDVYGDYIGIDPAVLNNAAERGNAVHEAIERSIIEGKPPYTEREDAGPYLEAYDKFIKLKTMVPIASEIKTWHPDLDYAGTIDILALVYGKPAIVDIKTTVKLNRPACELQLSGYGLIAEWWTGIEFDRYILKLDRNSGRKFDRISDRNSDRNFIGLVENFHARS